MISSCTPRRFPPSKSSRRGLAITQRLDTVVVPQTKAAGPSDISEPIRRVRVTRRSPHPGGRELDEGVLRFHTVLNSDGGTLRTTDLKALTDRIARTLAEHGHSVSFEVVSGEEVVTALERAARARKVNVVMAGGGDGTISAAAAALMGKKKALAVLPAGTMNLFARGLGIPLSLDKAIEAFATGEAKAVDMATANGRPFVHQFSIGMHAKMVHLRSKMEFGSRWGKMGASARAAYATLMNPPSLQVELKFRDVELTTRTTGIGITNNLFGEGTLPYAHDPAGGTLGVYITVARQRGELLRFIAKLARGKWRDNEQVEVHEAEEAVLTILSKRFRHSCVIDGELMKLDRETTLKIHPSSLNVWAPRTEGTERPESGRRKNAVRA